MKLSFTPMGSQVREVAECNDTSMTQPNQLRDTRTLQALTRRDMRELISVAKLVNTLDLAIQTLRSRGAESEANALLVIRQILAGEPA